MTKFTLSGFTHLCSDYPSTWHCLGFHFWGLIFEYTRIFCVWCVVWMIVWIFSKFREDRTILLLRRANTVFRDVLWHHFRFCDVIQNIENRLRSVLGWSSTIMASLKSIGQVVWSIMANNSESGPFRAIFASFGPDFHKLGPTITCPWSQRFHRVIICPNRSSSLVNNGKKLWIWVILDHLCQFRCRFSKFQCAHKIPLIPMIS